MKRLILLLILFVNLQIVITHEDMQLFSYSTASAQHMTKEAGDNCQDPDTHLWYHVDVSDCDDSGIVSTPCRYCLKEFGSDEQAISERDRHEYECGRTCVECIYCGTMVQRKEMEVHYAFSCPYWQNVFNDPNSGIKSWEEYKKSMRISSCGGDSSGGINGDYGGSYASNSSHYFYMNPNIPVGYEGALIADFCYDGKAHLEELQEKYHYDVKTEDFGRHLGLLLKDSNSGLDCKLLAKKDGNKIVGYVLAFAGTDISYTGFDLSTISFPDVETDIKQVTQGMPLQYALALINASILSKYCKEHKVSLTFIGHSLGGGEAALASMVTGYPAVTYNPAAVSNATINKLKEGNLSTNTSHILQYIIKGEPVHFINDFTGNPSQGRVIYVQNNQSLLRNFLTGHFISSMIDGLKQ